MTNTNTNSLEQLHREIQKMLSGPMQLWGPADALRWVDRQLLELRAAQQQHPFHANQAMFAVTNASSDSAINTQAQVERLYLHFIEAMLRALSDAEFATGHPTTKEETAQMLASACLAVADLFDRAHRTLDYPHNLFSATCSLHQSKTRRKIRITLSASDEEPR